MTSYTVKINDVDVYTTESNSKKRAFNLIRSQLPNLLSYPHFWCLLCCPNNVPMTIPEQLIYFSEPYRYYMAYKDDPDRSKKIETDKGYYFQGMNIITCMKELNYFVTGSDSDTSDKSDDNQSCNSNNSDQDAFADEPTYKQHTRLRVQKRRKKMRCRKARLMGGIVKKCNRRKNWLHPGKSQIEEDSMSYSPPESLDESSSESEYEGDEEDVYHKYLIYYIKKYMTYDVLDKVLNYNPLSEENQYDACIGNRRYDTIKLVETFIDLEFDQFGSIRIDSTIKKMSPRGNYIDSMFLIENLKDSHKEYKT